MVGMGEGDPRLTGREILDRANLLRGHLRNFVRVAGRSAYRQAHGWFVRASFMLDRSAARRRASPRSRFRALAPGPRPPHRTGIQPRQWPRTGIAGRWFWASLAAALLLAIALPVGFALFALATLPIDGGLQVDPAQRAVVMEAEDGHVFATRGVFRGDKLTAADLPPYLGPAVIAIEDRRFYSHHGVDSRGTLRALWRDTRAGASREGGSTITQQLVRLTYLSLEKNLRRKVQEALISLWLAPPVLAAPADATSQADTAPSSVAVRGFPEVIDTGTLSFGGRLVHLQGVDGESGRLARQLARFMRRREVTCLSAESAAQRCRINGQDLSTMILEAGGAHATPDAPPELLAARTRPNRHASASGVSSAEAAALHTRLR